MLDEYMQIVREEYQETEDNTFDNDSAATPKDQPSQNR
jgi:hypothetical protein